MLELVIFRSNMVNMRIKLEKVFFDFMKEIDFSIKPELPIISPKNDESLYFTNSTIVNFRDNILNNCVTNQSTRQKCLRLHNMSKILNNDFKVEWLSYFNMLGLVAKPENGEFIKLALLKLLIDKYKINKDAILLMAKKQHYDLYSGFPKDMLVFDTHNNSYYDWTYHMPEIYGEGLTFSVKQPDNTVIDIGNLIQIKKDSKVICYEIAYGLECIDWAINDKKSLFSTYPICNKYYKQDDKMAKVIDTVLSITAISSSNIVPTNKSAEGQILKKLYKNLVYLAEDAKISDSIISEMIVFLSRTEFDSTIEIEKVMGYYFSERLAINNNRSSFLIEKDKLTKRYNDGQLDYMGINKKLLNIAEGKYPISPHEREKYMSFNTLKVK